MGDKFDSLSGKLGALAGAAGIVTAASYAGEAPSFGADTPFTAAGTVITPFLATGAWETGQVGAALHSYAINGLGPLVNYNLVDAVSRVAAIGIKIGHIPGVKDIPILDGLQEAMTDLSSQLLSKLAQVRVSCGLPSG